MAVLCCSVQWREQRAYINIQAAGGVDETNGGVNEVEEEGGRVAKRGHVAAK
jgi:hypothetical protein